MKTFEEIYAELVKEHGCNAGETFAKAMFDAGRDISFTEAMFRICVYVTDNFYKDEPFILLNEIFAFCRDRNIDIFWHIEQKIKYNELRPYKHSNKLY